MDRNTNETRRRREAESRRRGPEGQQRGAESRRRDADGQRRGTGRAAQSSPRQSARDVALQALEDVTRGGAYSQLALNKRLRESRLSVTDKRLATAIFYAALENRLAIQWQLSHFAQTLPRETVEDILHIALAQILYLDRAPDHAVVNEAVAQTRSRGMEPYASFVNGTLRSFLRARDAGELPKAEDCGDPIESLSISTSTPRWLCQRLMEQYGSEEAGALISWRPDEREVTVRPNLLSMTPQAFEEYARTQGWQIRKGAAPMAYHLKSAGDLAGHPGFRNGLFSLESDGSMLCAMAVSPKPGQIVLDACAAPGGKACLMAEMMRGAGRVHAWELHEKRAELIRAGKRRLRLDNMRVAVRDARIPREECFEAFDAVLIDAPCTGTGVAVSKPDIKYRVSPEGVSALAITQAKILEACARYPRPGGALVYSTCSVLAEENAEQVSRFLAAHPEYAPDPEATFLPAELRGRYESGMIQLLPHRDGIEGFFIARLRRLR